MFGGSEREDWRVRRTVKGKQRNEPLNGEDFDWINELLVLVAGYRVHH